MIEHVRRAWSDFVAPIWATPHRKQVAALCYEMTPEGCRVLLITSRDTGRWIVPKGWPMKGKSDVQAALQEAWEEAGVRARATPDTPLGSYTYDKGLKNGESVPVRADVYAARVETLSERYPEVDQRKRAWFDIQDAAAKVDEPELQSLLRAFSPPDIGHD